jgi:DNA-binding transcriptional MocR family regulator
MHLVGFLPEGTDDRKVVEHPAQQGVSVSALSSCYAGPSRPGLLLGFGAAHEADADDAVHTLATAIRTVL